ncbi:MAG: DEAD/DEAH box helicase [Candidatus Pacebacteria bacterium]|nr:DEAD/DEAH box helicase [Candidatus Paceibacterota bacterium]
MYKISTPLGAVTGIGPALLDIFHEKNIKTVGELLLSVPNRYLDNSLQISIADLVPGERATILAEVVKKSSFRKGKRTFTKVAVQDETGSLQLMWFNARFVQNALQAQHQYFFSGVVGKTGIMIQPSFERVSDDTVHTNRIVPIYSSTLGIMQGRLRRILKEIVDNLEETPDGLDTVLKKENDQTLAAACVELHFPSDPEAAIKARERLALEELVELIRIAKNKKIEWTEKKTAQQITLNEELIPNSIPFTLTESQITCSKEIVSDLTQTSPMNRLLTGDVGSGKTVVAGIACYHMIRNGHSAFMIAPTQVLAAQHFQTLQKLFPDLNVELVTSNKKAKSFIGPRLYVGTHSLNNLLDQVNPGLVIYDEQHRFGVGQRSKTTANFEHHRLTMTATPIPRSLTLTLFANLSHSSINELPKNRLPTKTWTLPEKKRDNLYEWLKKQRDENSNFLTLVVCPFINKSDQEGAAHIVDANTRFKELKKELGKEPRIVLLHSRQPAAEKDATLERLFTGDIDILVSTPIIEVGVDIPQASAIIIESAQQYGLASLHQLRGRVGRAGQQGYCYLFSQSTQPKTKERLEQFISTTDGKKLAEFDLQNRGAGDLFGLKQHGFSFLQFASWTNFELISKAQRLEKMLPKKWHSPLLHREQLQTIRAN